MSEYEMRILINELEKLVVSQSISLSAKEIKIERLGKEVERLEAKLKEKEKTNKSRKEKL